MPGLGKTTMAKKLYNHLSVSHHFDRRCWCVISETYQKKDLLIGILIAFVSQLDESQILKMKAESSAEEVGILIYKNLKRRRYLIIMDDVWESNTWDHFCRYFPDDRNGSRIMFTSRNKGVAPSNSIIYGLPYLSNDQCWELLQKKVFHAEPCPLELLWIGKEIAENCHGLPLAVVVVAGILSTVHKEESTWENVRESLASYIFSEQDNSTKQILKLSYKHLPDDLKPCFLYFATLPQHKEIKVKKLKFLWIAEGFISKNDTLKGADNIAEQYLKELINRSLVMVASRRSDGGVKGCIVHDLLRDLCLRLAEEENFLTLIDSNYPLYVKHLRLRIHKRKPNSLCPSKDFAPFGHHIRSVFDYSLHPAPLDFNNLKLLIVLDLPRNKLSCDDGSEHLVHLKYLVINCKSTSIGSLVNLEFLILMDARGSSGMASSISSAVQKLVKLKYLSCPKAYFNSTFKCCHTNNLEFLSYVHIDKLEDEQVLKYSPHLRTLKCTLRSSSTYHYLDLSFLTQLESLSVRNLGRGGTVEIIFPSSIKKLTLCDLRLPSEKMSIIGGLPKLKVLKLYGAALLGEIWNTGDDEFQQLIFLKLKNVNIAQWNVSCSEHFPKLQRLVLQHCNRLQEIPFEIGEIVTLQLIEVESCPKSVEECALQIKEEQQDYGNEELRVIIT